MSDRFIHTETPSYDYIVGDGYFLPTPVWAIRAKESRWSLRRDARFVDRNRIHDIVDNDLEIYEITDGI